MALGPVNVPGMNAETLPWNGGDVWHGLSDMDSAIAMLGILIRQNKWDGDSEIAALQAAAAETDSRLEELAFAEATTAIHALTLDRALVEERIEVTLENTLAFPFNTTMNSPVAIALTKTRNSTEYSVEAEVLAHEGQVGEIEITAKARNGFKISFSGSGSSVKLLVKVKGGIT